MNQVSKIAWHSAWHVTSLVFAGVTALAGACSSQAHESEPASLRGASESRPMEVRIVPVREAAELGRLEFAGTVRSEGKTDISSSILGTVRSVRFEVGSEVREGELLIQLSAGEIQAKELQAEAMLRRANLDLARAEQLKGTAAIASADYDAALAQRDFARASLAEARSMRSYTSIRAPMSGVITAKQCNVGDIALPGRPLFTIENPEKLRLEVPVSETSADALAVNQTVAVRFDSQPSPIHGRVVEKSPSADPASRSVLIKVELADASDIRLGMYGRLQVPRERHASWVVPITAVLERGQLDLVYVAHDDVAELRFVRLGQRFTSDVEILSGVRLNERVIDSPPGHLRDGQKIRALP